MNKFYFNTGVRSENVINFPYDYHYKKGNVINGTLCIPFECDAPSNAKPILCCDNPNLPESSVNSFNNYKGENRKVIVCEMFNTNMVSKYAYLSVEV